MHRTSIHLSLLLALAACGDSTGSDDPTPEGTQRYALGSVVIDADGNRTTYVQVVDALDGPFDNSTAIELPGNGVVMAHGPHIFVGLAEEPTWVRYTVSATGQLAETGRMSLLNFGATYVDFGNTIVDDTTAVSVLSGGPLAVVWDPSTMTITRTVELPHLVREGYDVEVWTTVARDGRVYIPGRWSDWTGGRIFPGVSMTILDPVAGTVIAHAQDDRCASGGRAVFGDDGALYVMGDGRTYSAQMFANASGGTAPDNCLLRIPAGGTAFEEGYYHSLPSLTGGLQSISELQPAQDGSGVGFAKMFHPDQLPEGVEPVDFAFWSLPAHKLWRLELGDTPRAQPVLGLPFSTIGFGGSSVDGKLYSGESPTPERSDVFEIDPDTNTATLKFQMDGYFNGLYPLSL